MKTSLLKKILAAIIVILLPIIVSLIYIYHNDKQFLIDNIQKELTVIADAYEGQIYQFLEMSRSRVNDFASDGIIREHFQDIIEGRESGDKFLNDYLIKNKKSVDKSIHSISLMTFDGRILVSTDRSRIGKQFEIDAAPAHVDGRSPFIGTEVNFSGMEQIVSLAPVFSIRHDIPLGIIVNHIFLTELNRLLTGKLTKSLSTENKEGHKRRTFEVYLVNGARLMITESRFIKESILRQAVNTAPVNACLEEDREMSGLYPDYRGIEVAGASMCIPSMKWTLLAEIDTKEVLAPLVKMRRNAIIASIGVIGIIILFFIFIFRNVIVPLRNISGAAEGIASGNYEITVPVQSHDEIGRLAALFNKMGQEIENRTNLLKNSEERLRAIIDNSASVIYLKDTDGKYLLVNRRFKELFRITNQEITGKTDFDLFPEEFARTFRENDIKVLRANTHIEFDEMAPQDDGIHNFISVKFPVSNIAGVPLAVCGISTDITERKRLTEERLELQKKYEELVNNLNVGIYRISEGGDIIEANSTAIMLSGAESREALFKHNVRDFFVNKKEFREFIDRILIEGSITNMELELVSVTGNKYYASISAVRKRDKAGKIYIDGIMEDVTKFKSLEVQLRLSQKMEAVGQLAAGIAHDFNNILTGITGYGTLLTMKTAKDPVLKGYASQILVLAERAAILTQGLLAFSRKQIMNPEVHDLNEIAKRFVQILAGIIGGNIEVISRLSDQNLPVMTDSSQIEQVLMNLAANSKDALAGGGTITIETSLISTVNVPLNKTNSSAKEKFALLRFTDSGMGIPTELRDKIFDPFFTTKEVGKGTGLGLSMVHGIIEQHNGIITVESEVSKGTTFNIYLPISDHITEIREA